MVLTEKLRRPSRLAAAALLLLASIMPLLVQQKASAYTLLGPREIRMSTSRATETNATYRVKFDLASTGNIGGIVVTFCAESPIIEDTSCDTLPGFDLTGVTVSGQSTGAADPEDGSTTDDISTLTTTELEDHDDDGGTTTEPNTITLSTATPVATTAGEQLHFEINGVNNPTGSNSSFYARIYTYATEAAAQGYTLANPNAVGSSVDAGGIAMSTADQITIQAKVQERLVFCVYTSAINGSNDCAGATTTNPVVLGDANGVLDSSEPSISKDAKYSITTNASQGARIRAKGATLTSGSFTIDAANAGASTGAAYAADTEQFGLCTYRAGGSTSLTATDNYDGDTANPDQTECAGTTDGQGAGLDNSAAFTFDTTTANVANATDEDDGSFASTYGDVIATKAAGAYSSGVLVFLGSISNTTEPGIYTTTLTFIATGNY